MYKKNKSAIAVIITVVMGVILFLGGLSSCKSAPAVEARLDVAVFYIADKFRLSYNGLPCEVFLSNGTIQQYITDNHGCVVASFPKGVDIEKLEYTFSRKYIQKQEHLHAKRDFKSIHSEKYKIDPKTRVQLVPLKMKANETWLILLE